MIKNLLILITMLALCVPCYGIRLPNTDEYQVLQNYIEDTQENDIASGRDPSRSRKGSQDKKPWQGETLLGMETEVPPSPNCNDPLYRLANPEECDPLNCDDAGYALTHPDECGADGCNDPLYALYHPEECEPHDSCEDPYYALAHEAECYPLPNPPNPPWPPGPTPTCNDPWYKLGHPEECTQGGGGGCPDFGDTIAYAIRIDTGGYCIDEDSWECPSMEVTFYNCDREVVDGPTGCGDGGSCSGGACACGSCSGSFCYPEECVDPSACVIDGAEYGEGVNDLRTDAMTNSGCCLLPK